MVNTVAAVGPCYWDMAWEPSRSMYFYNLSVNRTHTEHLFFFQKKKETVANFKDVMFDTPIQLRILWMIALKGGRKCKTRKTVPWHYTTNFEKKIQESMS